MFLAFESFSHLQVKGQHMGRTSVAGLVLLLTSAFPSGAASNSPKPPERILVLLGQNDPYLSTRVLRQMESCTDGTPTAVVSVFDEFRIAQDFTTERGAVLGSVSRAAGSDASAGSADATFSLAAQLPPEKVGKARSLAASLQLLAEALAPVGPSTAIVLVNPRATANWGGTAPSNPERSPGNRSTDDEPVSTGELGFLAPAEIPGSFYEARKALRNAGVTLVVVNTSRQYDAGAKALTEIPRGRYLSYSEKGFHERLVAAVCAPGR